jgi:hypothetical protein
MSEIRVPVDELARVADLLSRTEQLMGDSLVRSMGGMVDAMGDRRVQDAARDFEKSWGDGRFVLGRDLVALRDASRTAADAFRGTDEQTANALTQGNGGQ